MDTRAADTKTSRISPHTWRAGFPLCMRRSSTADDNSLPLSVTINPRQKRSLHCKRDLWHQVRPSHYSESPGNPLRITLLYYALTPGGPTGDPQGICSSVTPALLYYYTPTWIQINIMQRPREREGGVLSRIPTQAGGGRGNQMRISPNFFMCLRGRLILIMYLGSIVWWDQEDYCTVCITETSMALIAKNFRV